MWWARCRCKSRVVSVDGSRKILSNNRDREIRPSACNAALMCKVDGKIRKDVA
jgi:hypothetical protein